MKGYTLATRVSLGLVAIVCVVAQVSAQEKDQSTLGSEMKFDFKSLFKFLENVFEIVSYAVAFIYDYITSIPRNIKIYNSMKSIPKFGRFCASTYQLLRFLRFHKRDVPSTVMYLEVIRGYSVLEKKGILLTSLIFKPMVFLSKVSTVQSLLSNKENVEKSFVYHFMKPWLRNGLFVSGKELWRDRRKKIAPSLHPKLVNSYFPIFQECALTLANKLAKTQGQEVDILPLMSYCALDIVIESTMGVKLGIQNNEDSKYLESIHLLSSAFLFRLLNPLYLVDWIFKLCPTGKRYFKALDYARNFTMTIIEERKFVFLALKKEAPKDVFDFKSKVSLLDFLLEMHLSDDNFRLEDVQDEVEAALFGGHDTVAVNMSWVLFLLGQNESAQMKVHQELDEVLGSYNESPVELDDLKRLPYLDCVIKEAARLYTPAPAIGRRLDEDLLIDDVVVPKGTECIVVIDIVHRDPDVYSDPEFFLPERFLPNAEKSLNSFAFLAFSSGPRGCPGYRYALLDMKVVLSTILRRFTVKSTLPRDKILFSFEMVQKPIGGLPVTFLPR